MSGGVGSASLSNSKREKNVSQSPDIALRMHSSPVLSGTLKGQAPTSHKAVETTRQQAASAQH
jgi:hypothetical protein